MKKVIMAVAVMGLAAGLAATTVNAATVVNTDERGYISVNTSANTELSPDVVEISIAVKTEDNKSLQKATAQNKEISDKVYTALKGMINTEAGDYVKTADFSAVPVYSYSGSKRNFDKYEVSNNVIVHTKNISKAGDIIDKAITLGATNINDLTFSVSNYDKQCNELLGVATKKAKARADVIAKNSSSYVTGIKSMNVSCSMNQNNVVQYRLMAKNMSFGASADAAAPESATPIQSGVIKLYANVNASFFVK
ncbi:TPA: SIMPL domain-containing protein [Candidatus Scatousia excrementigallinarum]|uniref:SIMPL domain-containing protein n=1 Tax=Candidatus Scatousia excrementigallinarum TaxID=2840935 RepID=A0A9D1EXK2_9BACT|nr:SIMPL domain-containing protein [Candidatus Scatousia excrementigallinarum]